MTSRFNIKNFSGKLEDSLENSPENNPVSPSSAMAKGTKISCTSSSKTRRVAIEKTVVSVPIKDVERLKLKGDQISAPPSDSWAWRKYGQKPIKGSPYPRGYYRCSSSKGCPARKQVERSRVDPNMLMVTYSFEHNHPSLGSRNKHDRTTAAVSTNTTALVSEEEDEEYDDNDGDGNDEDEEDEKSIIPASSQSHELISEDKFSNIGEFGWFNDFESKSLMMAESPILMEDRSYATDKEMFTIFTMREEDESDLYADLGELPECSKLFRREMAQREVDQRRRSFLTIS